MGLIKVLINMTFILSNICNNIEINKVDLEETNITTEKEIFSESEELTKEEYTSSPLDTYIGTVTSYTAYCDGCIGITASGYNVLETIYYYDAVYGNLRIVAMDGSIPFGSIIKLSNMTNYQDTYAIVLDRGGAISFNSSSQVDLLFDNFDDAINFGRNYNVTIEIIRYGY